jgi:hypothetical protein
LDTNEQMDLMICEQALELYSAILAAIDRGSGGSAKQKLAGLRSFLAIQTQHSAFRSAKANLPQANTRPYDWKPDLAASKSYIDSYARKLKRAS